MNKDFQKMDRYHHGNLRAQLIEAALEMIEESGTKDLTLRGIAKRAGVSHAAPYRHFKGKEALLEAVASEGFSLMLSEIRERISTLGDDPLARFRVCGSAYIDFALAHRAHFRVMFAAPFDGVTLPDSLKPESTPFFQLFLSIIDECLEAGVLKGESGRDICVTAWSVVHGFSLLVMDGHLVKTISGRKGIEEIKGGLLRSFYEGVKGGGGECVLP